MSEENLEILITMDDPGEDTLEEDTFHQLPTEKTDRLIHQPTAIDGESAK